MIKWQARNHYKYYTFNTLENYSDGSYVTIQYSSDYNNKKWSVNWPSVLHDIYYHRLHPDFDLTKFPYNFEFQQLKSFQLHVEKEYFRMKKLLVFT